MKTHLLKILAFVIFIPSTFFSQIKVEVKKVTGENGERSINRMITIDLSVEIDSIEMPVEKGNYKLFIPSSQLKSLVIRKNAIEYESLKMEREKTDSTKSLHGESDVVAELVFRSNTQYILYVGVTGEEKIRKYIIKSESDWKWTTSFGANAVFLTNRSRFISLNNVVAENRDGKMMDLTPSIMFTFINNQRNFSPGFTGGLGFDFEELSVFAGGALGIGQNIILTAGIAVHKQNRPNTDYTVGQTIDSSVTSDNLNKMQYRVNPFVGISFRFDKNPFVAK